MQCPSQAVKIDEREDSKQMPSQARESNPSGQSPVNETAFPAGDAKKPVIVRTAEALTEAILQGSTHIEIRQHLDLTTMASFNGPEYPIKLPLRSSTQSIRVRSLQNWWIDHCCDRSLRQMPF
jgi:hypothetical protein